MSYLQQPLTGIILACAAMTAHAEDPAASLIFNNSVQSAASAGCDTSKISESYWYGMAPASKLRVACLSTGRAVVYPTWVGFSVGPGKVNYFTMFLAWPVQPLFTSATSPQIRSIMAFYGSPPSKFEKNLESHLARVSSLKKSETLFWQGLAGYRAFGTYECYSNASNDTSSAFLVCGNSKNRTFVPSTVEYAIPGKSAVMLRIDRPISNLQVSRLVAETKKFFETL